MEKHNVAVQEHFKKRANKYNRSSSWVTDSILIDNIYNLSCANKSSVVLDLAVGTGLVANRFFQNVQKIIGIDICKEMISFAQNKMDEIVISKIEEMPFPNNFFDICVCRQGLQFVDLDIALQQIYRVVKPGGAVVLAHLTSYAEESADECALTFAIQKLRNPARKNFFKHNDLQNALIKHQFKIEKTIPYITRESITQWVDHGANSEQDITMINELFLHANETYKKIHNVEINNNDIIDHMQMLLIKAIK